MKKVFYIYICLFLISWLCVPSVNAQEAIRNGRVLNSQGKSVKGAKVTVVGKDISVTTDDRGFFNISVDDDDVFLIEAGLSSLTLNVKKDKANYILDNYHELLEWGLGNTATVEQNTAAISTVYSNKLSNNSVFNPANALYGQLAGLTVLQNGGTPWSRDPSILVRGIGSLGNNGVLVIIDGVQRPLSSLVIDDIESISVLKDASALAIYGQRGANGAIVVTTKRGEYESFSVEASYQYGLNTPTRQPKMLDAYHYAQAVNEASALDGNPFVYSPWDLADYQSGDQPYYFPNVDWQKESLNEYGISTNFNTQFKGGGKNVRYFSTLNYQTEKGIFNNTDLDDRYDSQLKYSRFNVRANIDADVTSSTLVSLNVNASLSDRKQPGVGVSQIMNAIYGTPSAAFPVKTESGLWGGSDIHNNPVALISASGYRQDFHRELLGDLTIKQDLHKVVKGLSAEVTAAFDNSALFWEGKVKSYEYENVNVIRDSETGLFTDTISTILGRDSDLEDIDGNHNQLSQWRRGTLRAKVDYHKEWENSHVLASVLYQQDKYVGDKQYNTWLRQNVAGHVHYGFKNKYLADFTLSYAGSSNLQENNRFGIFPALSVGWVLSEEDFLSSDAVDMLKLRASYGLTGSDAMEQNLYDQEFTNGGSYLFGNNYSSSGGIRPGRNATIGLTYETSAKANVGIDLMAFNKLSLVVDAFYEKRSDILVSSNGVVSSVIGVNTSFQNAGEVENKGVEADLQWNDQVGSFNYYVGGNFSFVRNKILNFNEMYLPYDYMKSTGRAVGQNFGLEAIGFFQDEEEIATSPTQYFSEVRPGDIKYKDQNDDGVIDQYDEVSIGHSSLNPEIYYGINLGFEMKGFGVDAMFQGVANYTTYLNTPNIFLPLRNNTNISDFSSSRWVPQNMDGAELPRLSLNDNDNNYRRNSIWLADASYLKLRSLNVYYHLPKSLLSKVKLGNATVFARGMNLFSIDKIKVVDPEATGITYPTLASYHLGLTIGF